MQRLLIIFIAVVIFAAGCVGQPAQPTTPVQTETTALKVTRLPSITPIPPTPMPPLTGSATPTPLPTDENALKPLLRSAAETANQGAHTYRYDCYAWDPCQCIAIKPRQIEITFKFSSRSVELVAGDYTQSFIWETDAAYTTILGTLSTQLTFFEDGFELYTVIDKRSCTQERYSIMINPTATP
jgi:hypothetical protein